MSCFSAEPDPPIYTPKNLGSPSSEKSTIIRDVGHASRRPDGGTTCGVWSLDEFSDDAAVLLTTYSGTASEVTVTDGPSYVSFSAESPEGMLD